jgi:phosphopantothenoylcysteine synthetase/decarboxylase
MDQKRVLLIIGGGIAAYKSLLLIRLLRGAIPSAGGRLG